jgi:competence protein ComEC
MTKSWKLFIFILLSLTILSWLAVFSLPDNRLHIVACNVGEGDAILISFRSSQVLIDGGPNAKAIDCLSSYMPFWDRTIEVVILTHPDRDHMAGLIDVFKRYTVKNYVENYTETSKVEYQVLKSLVGGSGARVVTAREGTRIGIGKIYLDILNGYEDNGVEKKVISDSETNDLSLVTLLKYNKFEALLTGDAPSGVLENLYLYGYLPEAVNYIKISHHGSKTGLTRALLELIKPEVAIISVGKNGYGHPADEIVNLLEEKKVGIFRTDLNGNVEIVSDGNTWWREK